MARKKKESPQVAPVAETICAELKRLGAYELNLGITGWRWFGFPTTVIGTYFFVSHAGEIMAGETLRQAQKTTLAAIKGKVKSESEV